MKTLSRYIVIVISAIEILIAIVSVSKSECILAWLTVIFSQLELLLIERGHHAR